MRLLRKHLSVANVLSGLALFVALSGVAYATASRNSVTTRSIVRGAVTTAKLHNRAVTTAKLRKKAVSGAEIANGAVDTARLADAAVRSRQLGGGVVTEAKLKDRAVGINKIAAGAVTDYQLAPDAVGSGKILDGSITAAEISAGLLSSLVRNVVYVSKASESDMTTSKSVFVECPAPKRPIGGGAQVVGNTSGVAITKSAPPIGIDNQATSWAATAAVVGVETEPWAVEVFAICAQL